ncbi:MAG TPA: chorismate synthase [Thermotogota bacterium]|nr:chorismate synthase [Thermotogota bacterium]HRW34470.1 chorismate synthase [Thermotogota bacterium]
MFLLNYLKVQIAGDSHGPAIYGIIEGFPFGFSPDKSVINEDLRLRQIGYGRGLRMKQEKDTVEIESGIWKGFTTNMPLVMRVKNRGTYPESSRERKIPRPGHADYAAYVKYANPDMRIYAEGASARRTAATVAVGSLCRQWLSKKGVEILGYVQSCGTVHDPLDYQTEELSELRQKRNSFETFTLSKDSNEKIKREIDQCAQNGDTLGGSVGVLVRGLQAGFGSFSSASNRLDALLAGNICAIPSVKGLYFGNTESYKIPGSKVHDRFSIEEGQVRRTSNNAGGLEGGMSNGNPIKITVYFKPIPSLSKPIDSFNVETLNQEPVDYVRSDVTAIAPAAIVSEAVTAITVMDFVLNEKERIKEPV